MPKNSPDTFPSPEETHPFPGTFEDFIERNQKLLGILAAVLVIVAAGVVIYRSVQSGREHAAGEILSKANDLPALQEVSAKYPRSAAAGSSRLLAADLQWQESQQDTAIQTLQQFLSDFPKHPARPTALASLGAKLTEQGKTEQASKALQELADDPSAGFLAPYALISLGDLARTGGNPEQAASYYEKARDQYSGNHFADAATRRIALLKAQAPVEIDPPAAPEPAGTGEDVPEVTNPFLTPTPNFTPPVPEEPEPPSEPELPSEN